MKSIFGGKFFDPIWILYLRLQGKFETSPRLRRCAAFREGKYNDMIPFPEEVMGISLGNHI